MKKFSLKEMTEMYRKKDKRPELLNILDSQLNGASALEKLEKLFIERRYFFYFTILN
jgi:hypothetical protein